MTRPLLLTTAFLVLGIAPHASAQKAPRQVRLDPIPQLPAAFLEKDYQAQKRAWAERSLLAPAQKQWQGKPWAEDAATLVREAFVMIENESAAGADLGSLAPRFRKLLEVSENDPLIAWLGARALKDERSDWRDAQPTLDRALKGGATLSAALECYAMQMELSQVDLQGRDCPEEQQRLVNAAIRAVSDGSYDAEAEAVFVRDQMHFMDLAAISTPEPWLRWQEAVRNSQWPEWVKLTLEGVGEKELAWVKRSSSWASNVSQEQWEGFAEHLKKARDLLAKANRLRPDRPEAAASMITVAMGESVDLTEIRDWFDRSVSAQFDYGPAYHSFAWALRPRWGGSYDLMLAFGKVCGETRRFETMVPSRLMTVCISINEEVNNVRQVFRHPAIREDVVAIAKGYLAAAAAAPPQTRHLRISNAALCAWLADDDPLAATCLKEAGAQLHPATVRYLNEMLLHESLMRAEIAADTGAYGEAVRAAANPPKEATMETVAESLQKIDDKELSPEALAYVQEGRELLSFKKSLATGDWVPLIARAGLTNFNQAGGGRWQAEPDGSLVATGTDTKWSALLWRMPVEEDVEVRAEVSYEIPKVEIAKNGYGVGAFLRWTPEGRARFMTFHQYSGQEVAHIYQNDSKEGSPLVRVKFEPVNHLRAWVIDRKLNFEVNGRRAGQITQDKIGLDSDAGQVGVVTFMLPAGAKARIRNLAVRKVDAKILAAESKRAPAAAAPVAAVAGGSKSNIPWKIIIFAAVIIAAFLVHRFVKAKEA